ncbi:MAG TPA: hypothetical protein VHW09_32135 [Bryobacteraceae bacterium]|jgi:hypothetical protein|nr:hypothetical protein [Bryobacteraceae bacterium]
MGQEIECKVCYRDQSQTGKAYLETDHLLFRGRDRFKVPFKDMTKVAAKDGVLKIEFAGGPAELELGAKADKWAEKILHPPTRMHKLGVKPGMTVLVLGEFEADFLEDLQKSHLEPAGESADLIFVAAEGKAKLQLVKKLAPRLTRDGALWIIYPRGVDRIREVEVIKAGRDADLKDVKVASFSLTHTALKFVIPKPRRRNMA